ncbi:MAG: tetratricopeptide repeat protein, partial [bacterium]
TGRVVMENEAPIPKDFYVQLLCSNRVIKQVNPSASGTFAFDLGSARPTPGLVDASGTETQGGLKGGFARDAWDERGFLVISGGVYLDVCLIRATPVPGLDSSTIELGVRDLQDNPDVGVIEVRPISGTPRIPQTVSVTSAAAPREATKALEKAQKELRKKKINYYQVEAHLERAVEVYSQFAEAWCLLGEARLAMGDHERARDAFQMSIASDESFIHPYAGLAQIDVGEQNWRRAADRARQIRELDPTYPRGLLFAGIANYYLQKFGDAEQSLEELKKRGYGPTFPIAYLHLGLIYAKNGKVGAAAEALRSYLSCSPGGQIPLDRRNKIEAQLKVWEEQGLIEPVGQVADS